MSGAIIQSETQMFRLESQLKPCEVTDSGQSQSGRIQVHARQDAGAFSCEYQRILRLIWHGRSSQTVIEHSGLVDRVVKSMLIEWKCRV
jgi:hypothetical protein